MIFFGFSNRTKSIFFFQTSMYRSKDSGSFQPHNKINLKVWCTPEQTFELDIHDVLLFREHATPFVNWISDNFPSSESAAAHSTRIVNEAERLLSKILQILLEMSPTYRLVKLEYSDAAKRMTLTIRLQKHPSYPTFIDSLRWVKEVPILSGRGSNSDL